MQTTVARLDVIAGINLPDRTSPAPNPAQDRGALASLKPTDIDLDTILAELPDYYAESPIGHGIIDLLYQAMLCMLGKGRGDMEIVGMFQQAINELRLGLEQMDCRWILAH